MEKSLGKVREEWEKTLSVKSVLDLEDRTVVILEDEKTNTYCIQMKCLKIWSGK